METVTLKQNASDNNNMVYIRSYLIYILMVIVASYICYTAITEEWEYGPTNFLIVLGYIAFFIILERIIPHKGVWHPTWKEWLRDGGYFILVVIAGALGQALVLSIVIYFSDVQPVLPLYIEAPAALLVASLGGYWFHRIGHENRFLWQVHGIHHTPDKVNLANNSVNNFIDIIGAALATQVPLFALGFSDEAMFIAAVYASMQGYFIHSNTDIRLGKLSYIIATPEAHRLHHSVDVKEAGNYGADIMLWDILFRSFTWREHRRPDDVGLPNPAEFPPTAALHRTMFHPFAYLYKHVILNSRT